MNRDLSTFSNGENHVKISHFTRKGMDIKGIIHVGANDWYEFPFYEQMGIKNLIGFEPLQEAVDRFSKQYPHGQIYKLALGNNTGEYEINVASGDGQSSSLLDMTEEYKKEFPDIKIIEKRTVKMTTFKAWKREHPEIRLSNFNCLVVDVEGMELDVLMGFGEYLEYFDMLNVECSGEPTYVNGPNAESIIKYLEGCDFVPDSPIEPHNDIMFIRRDL